MQQSKLKFKKKRIFTFGLTKHNWLESLSSTIIRLFKDCSLYKFIYS